VQMGLHEERVINESCVAKRTVEKHGVTSKVGLILKFKRRLDLSGTCRL
jgi:hypothetical protein